MFAYVAPPRFTSFVDFNGSKIFLKMLLSNFNVLSGRMDIIVFFCGMVSFGIENTVARCEEDTQHTISQIESRKKIQTEKNLKI